MSVSRVHTEYDWLPWRVTAAHVKGVPALPEGALLQGHANI